MKTTFGRTLPDSASGNAGEQTVEATVVANVRSLASSVAKGDGPDDAHIWAGVDGFVQAFDFRYIKVIREAVPKYRAVIVGRVNPLIRRFQLEELSADDTATRLVEDWSTRNFVTAGGFAIEELAIGVSVDAQKSATAGVDIQRYDPTTSAYHLYVLKSGLVTRNSDILAALKSNAKKAEKVLRQGQKVAGVTTNYAIASGKTSPTVFEDGVNRPSSDEFWAAMTGLSPEQAVELVLAMAAEAGRLIRQDASEPLSTLRVLVSSYISKPDGSGDTDWDWLARRTMRLKPTWAAEDKERHARALAALDSLNLASSEAGASEDGDDLEELTDFESEVALRDLLLESGPIRPSQPTDPDDLVS